MRRVIFCWQRLSQRPNGSAPCLQCRNNHCHNALEESGSACVTKQRCIWCNTSSAAIASPIQGKKQMELLKKRYQLHYHNLRGGMTTCVGKQASRLQSRHVNGETWKLYNCARAEGTGPMEQADHAGEAALHHCCEFGWREGIETLLLYGASLNAQIMKDLRRSCWRSVQTMWRRWIFSRHCRSNDRIEMEANAKQTDDAQEKTQKMEDDLERTETESFRGSNRRQRFKFTY